MSDTEMLAARRVKIVGTIGRTSSDPATLHALLDAGLDVVRLNMSHGTQDQHAEVIRIVRAWSADSERAVPILLDLQGPKIRVSEIAEGQAHLIPDALITLTTRTVPGDATCISTTYEALPRDVRPGDPILLDDGSLELRVEQVTGDDVLCRVVRGGTLLPRKGINLPGVPLSTSALTPKDEDDLAFGVRHSVDYIALSFVRQASDVRRARTLIAEHGAAIPVIAKIEKPEALDNIDAILDEADGGIMVARGDLGVEMPLERVPLVQKDLIARANATGRLVITATQMLESMITNARPTRAEASDVANAVLDGTDAVMLSAETANGQYPLAAVQIMSRIITEAERGRLPAGRTNRSALTPTDDHAQALARAATLLGDNTPVRTLVVFTQSGLSAHLVSKQRPMVPIIAFTESAVVQRRLGAWWGITAYMRPFEPSMEAHIPVLEDDLLTRHLAVDGETVIIMGGLPVMEATRANFLKLHRLGSER